MEENRYMHTLSVDVGGSGIKVIVLDWHSPQTERTRVKHRNLLPEAVSAIAQLAARQGEFDRSWLSWCRASRRD